MQIHSDEIKEIAEAVKCVQAKLEGASKDSVNPHFKSKYADLKACWDALRDILPQHGLSVIQTMAPLDGINYLVTTLLHESGQWFRSWTPLILVQNTPQSLGSAITYSRRYSLCAIVGLWQEDDDGNACSFASRDEVFKLFKMVQGYPDLVDSLDAYLSRKGIRDHSKIPRDLFAQLLKNARATIEERSNGAGNEPMAGDQEEAHNSD